MKRVAITVSMSTEFQKEDYEGLTDAELEAKAVAEVRDQLRVGQRTAGYWSATPADEVTISAEVERK